MDPQLAQALGRLEGKMDLVVEGLTKHVELDEHRFEDLHKKVDKLKSRWAYAAGAAAVITFLIANLSVFQSFIGLLPR